MLHYVLTQTSTGKIIREKDITDNWYETYHDKCIFDFAKAPIYENDGKTMICIDRQRDKTITISILDGNREDTLYYIEYEIHTISGKQRKIRYFFNYDRFDYTLKEFKNSPYYNVIDYSETEDK